jgi:hypothetical protein
MVVGSHDALQKQNALKGVGNDIFLGISRETDMSLPGIAVRRTASLPLAFDPAIHHFENVDGCPGRARP